MIQYNKSLINKKMKKTIFISALSLLGMFFISFSAQAAIYNYNLIQNDKETTQFFQSVFVKIYT